MKRPANAENTLQRIQNWRAVCPDITLRSTFIVGFPGETEQDFEELLQFLEAAQLDRVGAFAYSPVEGATANELANPVPEEIKEERLERFMATQQTISETKLKTKIDKTLTVLVGEITEDGVALARSTSDAPEIDGLVIVEDGADLRIGEFAEVKIIDSTEHDLIALSHP
jgi:ribosomal protein S12 methylthiotransferase